MPISAKSSIRACDACAIRKVKCSTKRPCSHCLSNNIKCTLLRQRKKSGPKNLHKKTLESINSLVEEKILVEEKVDYLLNVENLVENMNLLLLEPIIYELAKKVTVQSILVDINSYIAIPIDLDLMQFHGDSLKLLNLLIILSLNLIIVEILIKLKKQNFKNFITYPRRFILFRNFKNFKNLCHFKIIEIFTLIEKNSIIPPVIQIITKNMSQVYYNLSLSCLNLANYYHTLNLTNTLNSDTLETNYGNEPQEHQKIINLNRAISYFHLIKTSETGQIVKLYELFQNLFTFERYYLIFSSNNYVGNLLRNNSLSIHLNSSKINLSQISSKFNSNVLFEFMNTLHRHNNFENLVRANFNLSYKFKLDKLPKSNYFDVKSSLLLIQNQDSILDVIRFCLLFKVLLTDPIPLDQARVEFTFIIKNLNLSLLDTDLFKLEISNFQLIPHLLHLLKNVLEIDPENDLLIEFSDNLIKHFPFFNNINKLIRAHKILNDWFLNLSSNRLKKSTPPDIQDLPLTLLNEIPDFNFPKHDKLHYPDQSLLNNYQEQVTMSESTKNLYNLFHQISEEFSMNSHSITNLLQLNPQFSDKNDNNHLNSDFNESQDQLGNS